jgi:hypothetical protein
MSFILLLVFGFVWVNHRSPLHAQNPTKTLTFLYSNNINGEIDPCPT